MGDLVRHGAEQEAPRAGHALVADDDEVRARLLRHIQDRVGGIALASVHVHGDVPRTGLLDAAAAVDPANPVARPARRR